MNSVLASPSIFSYPPTFPTYHIHQCFIQHCVMSTGRSSGLRTPKITKDLSSFCSRCIMLIISAHCARLSHKKGVLFNDGCTVNF
ncbi:hypothetical protein B9Z55_014090 [Caenorhabditis nigoni]|uniref:Uncharacterized protein n=1 Tax=Caenorhabditis nigoni TaxID=1611254 RepID=A0A2G5U4G8_9PELO|nr:hypothetical protein B9Z55_014090 [Caenorhabditis nigoni]